MFLRNAEEVLHILEQNAIIRNRGEVVDMHIVRQLFSQFMVEDVEDLEDSPTFKE